jgi:hypothetical protein
MGQTPPQRDENSDRLPDTFAKIREVEYTYGSCLSSRKRESTRTQATVSPANELSRSPYRSM